MSMGHANNTGRLQVVRSSNADTVPPAVSIRASEYEAAQDTRPDARTAPKQIGILIFEDFSLVEVSSIAEVFSLANQVQLPPDADIVEPNYALLFLSSDGGSVASSCSMRIWTESLDTKWMSDCDALFIAGGRGAQYAKLDQQLLRRLSRVAPKISFVKAIGEGSQILSAANLSLQSRAIDFEDPTAASALASSLFIAEQTLTLDDPKGPIAAALSIIKRDYGAVVAREVSERSIPGAWPKLSAVLDDTDVGGVRQKIDAAARWMRENYIRPISIADAARVAWMRAACFLPPPTCLLTRLHADAARAAVMASPRYSASGCRFRRPSIGSRDAEKQRMNNNTSAGSIAALKQAALDQRAFEVA
jgi:transcriptional regulator GlxA family with amidase domain